MSDRSLTDEEANEMLVALSKHFQCPVMPINRYCEALRTWQRALHDRARRLRSKLYPGIDGECNDQRTRDAWEQYRREVRFYRRPSDGDAIDLKRLPDVGTLSNYESDAEAVDGVFLSISKSNLLARLLYEGEQLRTQPCPIHDGKWSGIEWGDNACPHGCQLTGWIQESVDKGKPLPGVRVVRVKLSVDKQEPVTIVGLDGEELGKAAV